MTRFSNKLTTGLPLAFLLFFFLNGCAPEKKPVVQKIHVVAATEIYKDIVSSIGGTYTAVLALIPPGRDPHSFDPDPASMQIATDADLVVFNGAGFEMWAEKITGMMQKENARVLWASEILKDSLLQTDEIHHKGHAHDSRINPHFWLDPVLMKTVAASVCEALVEIDAVHADYYQSRADAYIQRLDSLDTAIRATVDQWNNRAFVTTHSAWSYFCHRYGIREAAILEAGPGKEISVKQMAHIATLMREEHIQVIFTQHMFPTSTADALAEETGASVVALDPNGNSETAKAYIDLLNYNLNVMNAVMQ